MTISTGTIIPFGGASVPSGFLACDGSAVSRSTYAALFSVLGSTYGPGDGTTTFNVPDLTGQLVSPPGNPVNYIIATQDTSVGTVTSLGLASDASWFTISNSPISSSGNLGFNLTGGLSANQVLATPNGATGKVGPRLLVGADLPNPSTSQKGGVRAVSAVANRWVSAISSAGVPSLTQPAFSNLSGSATASQLPANALVSTVGTVIDGGGFVLTTGQKGYVYCPFAGTITVATLIADSAGSIVLGVWKAPFSTIPTSANSITSSTPPTLTSAQTSQDTSLTGWSKTVTAGDIFGFNINSVTGIRRIALQLTLARS